MSIRNVIRRFDALFIICFCSVSVLACLNPVGQGYISEPIYIDKISGTELVNTLKSHKGQAYWADVLNQVLDAKKNHPDDLYSANNHAVALAHLGRIKEAIAILETQEKKYPGLYETAANLGTAYELNGENEKALHWIKEGFRRDSGGHSGSEWLHVKILETKLKLAKDPDWLAQNSVLDIRFQSDKDPTELHTTDHLGQKRTLKSIQHALVYQLHERLEFVKPPEPIVADLLADLSNTFAITRVAEDSQAVYELAKSYGTTRPLFLKQPMVVADTNIEVWSSRSIVVTTALIVVVLIALGFGIRAVFNKKKHGSLS